MRRLELLQAEIEDALGLGVTGFDHVGTGSVNDVHRVRFDDGGAAILRIAPSMARISASWMTTRGLRREQAALASLESIEHLLPRTIIFDRTGSVIPEDWVLQSIVPGVPWTEAEVDLDTWRDLGRALRAIHRVPGSWFGPPSDGVRLPTWEALLREDLRGFRIDAEVAGADVPEFAALEAAIDEHAIELKRVRPVLIHSDLSPAHIFVQGKRLSGLIDFEFARFADVSSEGLLLEMVGREDEAADAFFEGYGRWRHGGGRRAVAQCLQEAWAASDRIRLKT
jgi:aminoglycoside phosphotransferase (APT) family kinase protein